MTNPQLLPTGFVSRDQMARLIGNREEDRGAAHHLTTYAFTRYQEVTGVKGQNHLTWVQLAYLILRDGGPEQFTSHISKIGPTRKPQIINACALIVQSMRDFLPNRQELMTEAEAQIFILGLMSRPEDLNLLLVTLARSIQAGSLPQETQAAIRSILENATQMAKRPIP